LRATAIVYVSRSMGATDWARNASGPDNVGVTFGPPEGEDILYVATSGLNIAITEGNIAVYYDALVADLDRVFREAQGRVTADSQSATVVAGLPAIRLGATAINVNGVDTKSHVVLVYDGKTEYYLNCQYTPAGAAEMKAGCDQAVASFQVSH
jgi:hypothetical protein